MGEWPARADSPGLRLLPSPPLAVGAADKKAPPRKPASEYSAANDPHPERACHGSRRTLRRREAMRRSFRVPYLGGILPIRVIFTNDSDHALVARRRARMQFISANNDKIPGAARPRRSSKPPRLRPAKHPAYPHPARPLSRIKRTPMDKKDQPRTIPISASPSSAVQPHSDASPATSSMTSRTSTSPP